MKLTTTNDRLQVVLASAVTSNQLQCLTTFKTFTSTTTTDGRVAINTNNTTDVDLAGPPSSGEAIDIQNINIYNNDTSTHVITIKLDVSGTETILYKGLIGVGDVLSWTGERGWINSSGHTAAYYGNKYVMNGYKFENCDRSTVPEVNTAALSTGRLHLQAIWLPAGVELTEIAFWSATTAAATPTNQIFGLYDIDRNLLRETSNDTTTAWAATTRKSLPFTSAYTTTYSGIYYGAIMVTAATVPTLKGITSRVNGALAAATPTMGGGSNTGLTTSLPATADAPGTVTTAVYFTVK